ncbi:MAG TPA: bifunctional methylenetetrahydrofolate dehydrogenase/methenyltetrahydrofolate cyclohydrolase FolD [Clostridiales bacterium]|nr:bifunctional methylenetetrahydrofolate dehydrogenase/methenyltetrahydrofolate cyclohydrolase FolD [Clostridiales bacterium]
MGKIIDGKAISNALQERLKEQVAYFSMTVGRKPKLAVIMVGDDPASQVYVRNKIRACETVGITSEAYKLAESTESSYLETLIAKLNEDRDTDGILVQLPLPAHLNAKKIIPLIDPKKDVDGFSAANIGALLLDDKSGLYSCTPLGIMQLILSTGINLTGKHAVVVGRSNEVGKPIALMLLQHNATVTICHSKTEDLAAVTRTADVLVVAVGKKHLITADMVKEGAVVIDVGINRDDEGKLCGDVDFAGVEPKASYITPVPGGVGPMTIAMLMTNTLKAAKRNVQ